jgi:hypothetical protein
MIVLSNFTLKFSSQKNKKGTVMIIGPTIKKYAQIFVLLSIPYFIQKTCSNPGPLFQKPCVPHIKMTQEICSNFRSGSVFKGRLMVYGWPVPNMGTLI